MLHEIISVLMAMGLAAATGYSINHDLQVDKEYCHEMRASFPNTWHDKRAPRTYFSCGDLEKSYQH